MTNRNELMKLRQQHNLTYANVAEICDVSIWTARSWFLNPDKKASRNKNDGNLAQYLTKLQDYFE